MIVMKMKISELESEIKSPLKIDRTFENKLIVEDEDTGIEVVYDGRIYNLYIEHQCLNGNASLSKYETDGTNTPSWSFNSERNIFDTLCSTNTTGSEFSDRSYRDAIKRNAEKEKNIIISKKLLGLVFDPLNKQVLDFYIGFKKANPEYFPEYFI
jgi:hypothetical protein